MKSMITDTRMKMLKVESDKRDRKDHNTALATVVTSLYESIGQINYDHIKLTLPKKRDIPLEVITRKQRKRADIAFHLPSGTLVHVEIKVHQKGSYITNRDIENLRNLKEKE